MSEMPPPAQSGDQKAAKAPLCPSFPHFRCRYGDQCENSCEGASSASALTAVPLPWAALSCVMAFRRRNLVLFILTVILALCGAWLGYRHTVFARQVDLQALGEHRLAVYVDNIERQIEKFGLLPLTASHDRSVIEFLQKTEGRSSSDVDEINNYLKTLNDSVGSSQTYLIDPQGVIVASSNNHERDSFVGRNISYRPYFQKAVAGRTEGYYGVGTSGNTPGYFLATAVESGGRRLGVVAIKIGLEQLEHFWLGTEQPVLVFDEHKVVILSSVPDWKYRVLGTLDEEQKKRLGESLQYNRRPLGTMQWNVLEQYSNTSALVRIGEKNGPHDYFSVTRPLPRLAMQLTVLTDPGDIFALAIARAAAVAVLIALAAAVANGLNQRRINVRERLAAREALQSAYGRLEILVEQRSAQLRKANEELQHEINERIRDAQQLLNFQEELIRTENLAVIGQVSAGIAHELNQPLAALSTLAANAVRFLERSDLDTVRFNLERICQLVARMGALTSQLRSFARRSSDDVEPVDLATCIDNSVALIGHRLDKGPEGLALFPPAEPLFAQCGAIRLEQVLVNLISNAIDAATETAAPHIIIRWRLHNGRALIEVSDNGIGLSEEVKKRLFEPFFTTKKNRGLGLGLAISADIIKAFGGTLNGDNGANGGAIFTIELRPVDDRER